MPMSTTLTRNVILLPLPKIAAPVWERSAFLYSALDSGWVRVCYRKADGDTVSRVCTRNRSLMRAMGAHESVINGIGAAEEVDHIVYWDYMAKGTRSFRVSNVEFCGIDPSPLEHHA